MLLAMNNATSASVFAARGVNAEILGVVDLSNKTEAQIGPTSLRMAIQFVANASVLGYDVRKAMVFYGDPGTPSLRARDCERFWAQYGGALLR